MARRSRRARSPSTTESESSDQESVEDSRSDTDLTDFEDDAAPPGDSNDANDAALLFADNEHPPEYYIQQLQNFDETIYTQEDYGKGTTDLLDRIEGKWIQ